MKAIRELLQQNKLAEVLTRIDALRLELDDTDGPDDAEVGEARAALLMEEGMLRQRMGDPRSALTALKAAVDSFEALPLDERDGRFRLQLTTALINLAVLFARERMHTDALSRLAQASEHLGRLPQAQNVSRRTLEMGILQNRAGMEMELKNWAAAAQTLERSTALGEELLMEGSFQWLGQVMDAISRQVAVLGQLSRGKEGLELAESAFRRIVEAGEQKLAAGDTQWLGPVVSASQQLANVLRQLGRSAEGLPHAERAARWAEAALESNPQAAMRMFVGTQLTLVDLNFATDQFAQAETHLFRAVDATDDPQAIIIGTGFYLALLRYDDERLARGDLPRDEVEESLHELIERFKGMNAAQELVEVIQARRAVMRSRTLTPAAPLMEKYRDKQLPAQSALAQLLQQLVSDLKWIQEQTAPPAGNA
jgi:tetratricopeptide (TPR) repeat protein